VSTTPRIEFVGLTKTFGDKTAVENLTLTVEPGQVFCLLGPNGAGKTTTLSTVVGLKRPTTGDVRVNGVSVHSPEIHEARRALGYVADVPDLYDYLTGREMLQFVAELYGVPGDVGALVDDWLSRFELQPDADKLTKTYSLGMRKKVAVAAALLYEPSLLVFDEPTGALDAASARVVKDLMVSAREQGRVVMFTTHVMEIAERLADRIAILHHGSLIADDPPGRLLADRGRPGDTLEDVFLRLTSSARPAAAASPREGLAR
jgi:ABC-2 type transport system ATP-binding protein